MHVDDEQMQRRLHAELDATTLRAVDEHLAACTLCRERASAAGRGEDRVMQLLEALDGEQSRVEARQLIARARTRDHAWIRRAASFLLAVGIAGTAYAAPGSPLPRWVASFIERVAEEPPVVSPVAVPEPIRAQDSAASGIAMRPDGALVVLFAATQASGRARVSLVNASEVTARSFGTSVPFRADIGRIVVENGGSSADFEILIPRDAPRVEIRVGSARVYLKDGDRITSNAFPDSAGVRVIPLRRVP